MVESIQGLDVAAFAPTGADLHHAIGRDAAVIVHYPQFHQSGLRRAAFAAQYPVDEAAIQIDLTTLRDVIVTVKEVVPHPQFEEPVARNTAYRFLRDWDKRRYVFRPNDSSESYLLPDGRRENTFKRGWWHAMSFELPRDDSWGLELTDARAYDLLRWVRAFDPRTADSTRKK